jgi:hypothetical protein
MGEKMNAYMLSVGKLEEKRQLGKQNVSRRIILGWIFRSWNGVMWTGLVCLRIGTGAELL